MVSLIRKADSPPSPPSDSVLANTYEPSAQTFNNRFLVHKSLRQDQVECIAAAEKILEHKRNGE